MGSRKHRRAAGPGRRGPVATLLWKRPGPAAPASLRGHPQLVHRPSTETARSIHIGRNRSGCFIAGPVAQSTRREETRRGRDGKPEGQAGGTLQDPRTGGRPSETGPGADHQGPEAIPDTGRSRTSRPQLPKGRWVRGRCGRATGSIVLLLVWGAGFPSLRPSTRPCGPAQADVHRLHTTASGAGPFIDPWRPNRPDLPCLGRSWGFRA